MVIQVTSDINNYIHIALVTAMSKIFKICILNVLEHVCQQNNNQFGFKKHDATDLCTFASQSVISYYNNFSRLVYSRVSDASKLLIK